MISCGFSALARVPAPLCDHGLSILARVDVPQQHKEIFVVLVGIYESLLIAVTR